MIPFAAITHTGVRRKQNEDSFEADEALGLWVVADGIGGHTSGDVASSIACATIREKVSKGAALPQAIEDAHQAVLHEINARDSGSNMGTTVVALRLTGQDYEIAWVGDSRAYLYDGSLKQLTRDHSAVNELLDSGAITSDQADKHPQRHALTRSLGVSTTNTSSVSVVTGKLRTGQQLLLCTDGITDELSDTAIAYELRSNDDIDAQAAALQSAALANGGRDNLTVVLLGSPRRKKRHYKQAAADLETTQNVAVRGKPGVKRSGKAAGITLVLCILLCVLAVATFIG